MSKKLILIAIIAIVSLGLFSQPSSLELTFTAVNNTGHVQMDSIKIMNLTQNADTMLYWPDTVLSLYYVGIPEILKNHNGFQIFQNYPNPVTDKTTISLYIPEKDKVSLIITDILGRVLLNSERVLEQGIHFFRFTPGSGNLSFFTAWWQGKSSSIKILQSGVNSEGVSSLEYIGSEDYSLQLKSMKDIQGFSFTTGDELLYIGNANGLESGMLDAPEESQDYTFQFATNIPCPGTPTVEYEGQVYNTIQIFSQCWLKENLNVGTWILGSIWQSDNEIIEKYCYNDERDSCNKYGGLYQWKEMMQYTNQPGSQGICPQGWHLPTDEEWKLLEGAVDSQYGVGDPEWDLYWNFRGYDAGTNLKTTSGWYGNGNGTDLFGFSGLPGGNCSDWGIFNGIIDYGYWWTSTGWLEFNAHFRRLYSISQGVYRDDCGYQEVGFSVRCLRDD